MALLRMNEAWLLLSLYIGTAHCILPFLNPDRPKIVGIFVKPVESDAEKKFESGLLSHESSASHGGSLGIQLEVKPLGVLGGIIDHAKKVIGRPEYEDSEEEHDEHYRPSGHGGGYRPGHGKPPTGGENGHYDYPKRPGHGGGSRPGYGKPPTGEDDHHDYPKQPGHGGESRPGYGKPPTGDDYHDYPKQPGHGGGNRPGYGKPPTDEYDHHDYPKQPGHGGGSRPGYGKPPSSGEDDHHDYPKQPGHGGGSRPGYGKPPSSGEDDHHGYPKQPGHGGGSRPGYGKPPSSGEDDYHDYPKQPGHGGGNRPGYEKPPTGGEYDHHDYPNRPDHGGGSRPGYGRPPTGGSGGHGYDDDHRRPGGRPGFVKPPRGGSGYEGHGHHDHHGRPHGHWGRPGYQKPPRGNIHGHREHHKPDRWGQDHPTHHEDYDYNDDRKVKDGEDDEPSGGWKEEKQPTSINQSGGRPQPSKEWEPHPVNPKPPTHEMSGGQQNQKEIERLKKEEEDAKKQVDDLPSWDDIGEEKTEAPFLELVDPRKPRPKRFIHSKIYHVPLAFLSNARPYEVKIRTENRANFYDEEAYPIA